MVAVCQLVNGVVCSTGGDRTIHAWNGDCSGHTSTAFALIPLPNGLVVSAAADRALRIWNVFGKENEKCVTVIETAHEDAVMHAILLSDGVTICTASADKTMRTIDLAQKAVQNILMTHQRLEYGMSRRLSVSRISPDTQ